MNIALRKPMTLESFLEWEERQQRRYEFDGFRPVAMTGGTLAHDRIIRTLHRLIEGRLGRGPCQLFGSEVKILVGGKVRYPDAVVTCTPQNFAGSIVEVPIVVFEVISDSTARIDRIDKVRDYQATPSIQRYVILEQTSIGAAVFERHGDVWAGYALKGDETLGMPEIGIELPLAECYAGLELPDADAPERDSTEGQNL